MLTTIVSVLALTMGCTKPDRTTLANARIARQRAQADAYSLSVAQSHWQTARQNQITSLQNYWLAYYHLRRLTLYDYQRHQIINKVLQ